MVNTFILSPDINTMFNDLDKKRLNKQKLEAKQIIENLICYDETGKFKNNYGNHSATQMWIGYTNHLKVYYNLCIKEWISRGYNNNMPLYEVENEEKYHIVNSEFIDNAAYFEDFNEYSFPPFCSFLPFIMSHKSSLLKKDPEYYADYANEPDMEDYYLRGYLWPSHHKENFYNEWSLDYLDPIGEGAPSHFRISYELAEQWSLNKEVNPKTGRKIKNCAKIYKQYESAAKYYEL